jgi:hypothetical protein
MVTEVMGRPSGCILGNDFEVSSQQAADCRGKGPSEGGDVSARMTDPEGDRRENLIAPTTVDSQILLVKTTF